MPQNTFCGCVAELKKALENFPEELCNSLYVIRMKFIYNL
jgi:hypothetical protein